MQVYFHHVGKKGADRDFPKTIGSKKLGLKQFQFSDIAEFVERGNFPAQILIEKELDRLAPQGFQIWGIPSGAKSVLENMSAGDLLLLLHSAGTQGYFSYLGEIIFRPFDENFHLSAYLWGEAKFPIVIFLRGYLINYPWLEFCNEFDFKESWNPAGQIYRLKQTRIRQSPFSSSENFLRYLVRNTDKSQYQQKIENIGVKGSSENKVSTYASHKPTEQLEDAIDANHPESRLPQLKVGEILFFPNDIEVSKNEFQKIKERADLVGRIGERLVAQYLEQLKLRREIRDFEWTAAMFASAPFDFKVYLKDGTTMLMDVKSTTGIFSRKLYISLNELIAMTQGEYRYDIYRVFELDIEKKTAKLAISYNVREFALSIVERVVSFPAGVLPTTLEIKPTSVPLIFNDPVELFLSESSV